MTGIESENSHQAGIFKPTAFLIHGFICAGKTTLAKAIEVDEGAVRISFDEWYIRLYGIDGQTGVDTDNEARLFRLIWDHWPRVLAAGSNVVLDIGLWSRADRDRARNIVRSLGARDVMMKVVTTDDVALARCAERKERPIGTFTIDRSTYFDLKRSLEPLTDDELAVTVIT